MHPPDILAQTQSLCGAACCRFCAGALLVLQSEPEPTVNQHTERKGEPSHLCTERRLGWPRTLATACDETAPASVSVHTRIRWRGWLPASSQLQQPMLGGGHGAKRVWDSTAPGATTQPKAREDKSHCRKRYRSHRRHVRGCRNGQPHMHPRPARRVREPRQCSGRAPLHGDARRRGGGSELCPLCVVRTARMLGRQLVEQACTAWLGGSHLPRHLPRHGPALEPRRRVRLLRGRRHLAAACACGDLSANGTKTTRRGAACLRPAGWCACTRSLIRRRRICGGVWCAVRCPRARASPAHVPASLSTRASPSLHPA